MINAQEQQKRDKFVESHMTLDRYDEQCGYITELSKHLDALSKCIAKTTDGYVIRRRTDEGYRYEEISNKDLALKVNVEYTLEESQTKANGTTETIERVVKPMHNFVRRDWQAKYLAHYDRVELFSSNPKVLSKYIPPHHEFANDSEYIELAEKTIKFLKSRMRPGFEVALEEEFASHAYRLRHPGAHVEKVFVRYDPKGNTGKGLLSSVMSFMYPNVSRVSTRGNQMTDKYNGWMYDNMYVVVDELENQMYRNSEAETFIKMITNRRGSGEVKYIDVKESKSNIIFAINTNSPTLYGLIRTTDNAAIERLVIQAFGDKMTDEDVKFVREELGLDDSLGEDYDKNCNKLGAALYKYFKEKYVIPDSFSPCRYDGKEKYDILEELRRVQTTIVEEYASRIDKQKVVHVRTNQKDKKEYALIYHSELSKSFNDYLKNQNYNGLIKYTASNVADRLKILGWEQKNTGNRLQYTMLKTQFDEMLEKQKEDQEFDDTDLKSDHIDTCI